MPAPMLDLTERETLLIISGFIFWGAVVYGFSSVSGLLFPVVFSFLFFALKRFCSSFQALVGISVIPKNVVVFRGFWLSVMVFSR